MIKINFFIMYEIIKDYVAQSLKLNGFRVKKDYRFPLSVQKLQMNQETLNTSLGVIHLHIGLLFLKGMNMKRKIA